MSTLLLGGGRSTLRKRRTMVCSRVGRRCRPSKCEIRGIPNIIAAVLTINSSHISSDEDEILEIIEHKTPKGKRRREAERDERKDVKRSRSRSRSRSITPPPAVPEQARQNAREAIRSVLCLYTPSSTLKSSQTNHGCLSSPEDTAHGDPR